MEETHWYTQCPNCRFVYDLPLQAIESDILQAVAVTERNSGKATTRAVAMKVMLSETQTYRYLTRLEQQGRIRRIGTKGGWRMAA